LTLAAGDKTVDQVVLQGESGNWQPALGTLVAEELERRSRPQPLLSTPLERYLAQNNDDEDGTEDEFEDQEMTYADCESGSYFMPYDNDVDNQMYLRQSGMTSRFTTSSIRGE
jgi:hypothetical protein